MARKKQKAWSSHGQWRTLNSRARQRAMRELAKIHRAQFIQLLDKERKKLGLRTSGEIYERGVGEKAS